jgi:hypothetical protein
MMTEGRTKFYCKWTWDGKRYKTECGNTYSDNAYRTDCPDCKREIIED